MENISEDTYRKDFDLNADPQSRVSEKSKYVQALEYAIRTREFEINLYWERAKYFWTFIGATFAAFGIIQKLTTDKDKTFLSILVSCIGLLFSFAWYCVNRGSKQWQENWENHVALLEDEVCGPLFKTVLTRDNSKESKLRNLFIGPGPFSVSKINQLVSIYVVLFWVFLLIHSTPLKIGVPIYWPYFAPILLTIIACIAIFIFGRSDFNERKEVKYDHIHKGRQFKVKIEPQSEKNNIGEQ